MSVEARPVTRFANRHAQRHLLWMVPLLAGLVFASSSAVTASAAVPTKAAITVVNAFTKNARALPDDEIVDLARLARQARGTKQVGKYLGQQNLPDEVLEDAYLRIAVQQKALARSEAEGMFTRLQGTPGFRGTLSKVIGSSDVKTAGHLNELRIADNAAQHGFKVKGIGERFDDGVKAAETDIDVLLEKGGRLIAIEAKDYAPTTPIPMDDFRADMVSLTRYAASQPEGHVLSTFTITNRPLDANAWRMLQLETKRRDIQLVEGSPQSQIEQVKMLLRIK
jgi:hypothetical protein